MNERRMRDIGALEIFSEKPCPEVSSSPMPVITGKTSFGPLTFTRKIVVGLVGVEVVKELGMIRVLEYYDELPKDIKVAQATLSEEARLQPDEEGIYTVVAYQRAFKETAGGITVQPISLHFEPWVPEVE